MSNKKKTTLSEISFQYARDTVVYILKKQYGMKDKEAKEIEEKNHKLVELILHEKYFYKDPLEIPKEFGKFYHEYGFDYFDWFFTWAMIPFCQSLGDTIGYHNGWWEFNMNEKNPLPEFSNELIYEFIHLGGVNDLSITNWMASDDTIMYLETFKVLLNGFKDINDYGSKLRKAYLDNLSLIKDRHGGNTTIQSLGIQENIEWNKLPYDSQATGSGASMRSGCIGMFHPGSLNRSMLISLATETARITHNSAIAILGSITAALFTAYAIERVPINHWPHKLLKLIKSGKIDKYMETSRPSEYHLFKRDKVLFIGQWEKYVNFRFSGLTPRTDIKFMQNPVQRIKYLAENFSKGHITFPGADSDDSVIIAYDSLLESGDNVEKLIVYSILHIGDSDTIGSIAFSWFGALYQSAKNFDLLESRFIELEYRKELLDLMYRASQPDSEIYRIYHYNIYLHFARKNLKKLIK